MIYNYGPLSFLRYEIPHPYFVKTGGLGSLTKLKSLGNIFSFLRKTTPAAKSVGAAQRAAQEVARYEQYVSDLDKTLALLKARLHAGQTIYGEHDLTKIIPILEKQRAHYASLAQAAQTPEVQKAIQEAAKRKFPWGKVVGYGAGIGGATGVGYLAQQQANSLMPPPDEFKLLSSGPGGETVNTQQAGETGNISTKILSFIQSVPWTYVGPGAVAGATLGALSGKKENQLRNALLGLAIGGGLGYALYRLFPNQ